MKKVILSLILLAGLGVVNCFAIKPVATPQVLGGRPGQSMLKGDVLDIGLREPGSLEKSLTTTEMDRVRSIRLSGSMNGDDIRFIRKVCDRSSAVDENGRKVSNYLDLDLEHVRIVGGGKEYSYRTEHDVIGNNMFSGLSILRNVTLPRGLRRIEHNAFSSCSNLEDVYFTGRDLRSIGDGAFRSCYRLSRINLPDGLESIGDECFYGCSNLRRIDLPYTLQSIGDEAFCDVPLTDIRLPRSLRSLGTDALKGTNIRSLLLPEGVVIEKDRPGRMPKLKEFLVERGNRYYTTEDGLLYDITGKALLCYPPAKSGRINVPDGVESINTAAFKECHDLTAVSLPLSILSIGAQYGCRSIENLVIEGPVGELRERAFQDCSSLKSISLPAELKRIGESAFESCKSLTRLDGATSIVSIGRYAFKKCGFTELILPQTVTKIEENAFRDCKDLKSITLSNMLTSLPKEMMRGCESLESINMPQMLKEIGENALRDCKKLETITLPEGLTTIDNNAFRGTAITQLTLPSTTRTIGDKIVEKCKMQSITCLATVPPELKRVSEKKTPLYVPVGTENAYRQAKSWKDFKNISSIE